MAVFLIILIDQALQKSIDLIYDYMCDDRHTCNH